MLKTWIADIKSKTAGMNGKDRLSYIATYYWYHILLLVTVPALIIILVTRAFNVKKPEFLCLVVNQYSNNQCEETLEKGFATRLGVNKDCVIIDSDYHFSYDNIKLDNANESSYEKLFFKWRNEEVDALIIPESFFKHCIEMSGRFTDVRTMDSGSFKIYSGAEGNTAVVIGKDINGEKLLLAFPSSGKHKENCEEFLKYFNEKGGCLLEKNIN